MSVNPAEVWVTETKHNMDKTDKQMALGDDKSQFSVFLGLKNTERGCLDEDK